MLTFSESIRAMTAIAQVRVRERVRVRVRVRNRVMVRVMGYGLQVRAHVCTRETC